MRGMAENNTYGESPPFTQITPSGKVPTPFPQTTPCGKVPHPIPKDHTLPSGYRRYFSSRDSSMIRASSSSSLMRSFLCSSCSRWDSSSANVSWSFSDSWRQGIETMGCGCWSSSGSIRSQDSDDGDDEEEGMLLRQLLSFRLSSRALSSNMFNKTYGRPWQLIHFCGAWWLIGRLFVFHPKGRGFEYCSSCHVKTLGKSFTRSCLWRFGVKLPHSIRAVLGDPLSSSGLEEVL